MEKIPNKFLTIKIEKTQRTKKIYRNKNDKNKIRVQSALHRGIHYMNSYNICRLCAVLHCTYENYIYILRKPKKNNYKQSKMPWQKF